MKKENAVALRIKSARLKKKKGEKKTNV